jgi:hypothetical protein
VRPKKEKSVAREKNSGARVPEVPVKIWRARAGRVYVRDNNFAIGRTSTAKILVKMARGLIYKRA